MKLYSLLLIAASFFFPALSTPLLAQEPPSGGAQVSSWEKPAAQPAAEAPKTSGAVAAGELSGGEKFEITELKRTSGDTVTLKMNITNSGSDELSLAPFTDRDWFNWRITEIFLIDLPNKKKYFILRDSENTPLSSNGTKKLKPGERIALWAKFPAPPISVSKVTVSIPGAAPLEDLAITN